MTVAPLAPVLELALERVTDPTGLLVASVGVDPPGLDRLRAAAPGLGVVDLDEAGVERRPADTPVPRVLLLAGTMTDLRRAVTVRDLLPPAERIAVAVGRLPYLWPAPLPSASAHSGWRHLRDLRVRVVDRTSWLMETDFARPMPAGEVLATAARAFGGDHLEATPQPRAGLAGHGVTHWRPGDPNATLTPLMGADYDIALSAGDIAPDPNAKEPGTGDPEPGAGDSDAGDGETSPGTDSPRARDAGPGRAAHGAAGAGLGADAAPTANGAVPRPVIFRERPADWAKFTTAGDGAPAGSRRAAAGLPDVLSGGLSGTVMVPPVDERSVNPAGFRQVPPRGVGSLEQRDGRWAAVLDGRVLTRFAASGAVTDADVAALRRLRGLRVAWRLSHTGPVAAARVIAGLAAGGVPLVTGRPPRWVEPLLGAELAGWLAETTEAALSDDLAREVAAIRVRRSALLRHGSRARWRQLVAAAPGGPPPPPAPKVSVVLCTRRADMVRFAIGQVARQRGVDLELVLALHGVPRAKVEEAVRGVPFPVTIFEADPALPLGAVLNQAFSRTSGTYVTKMDDDDWYGPDHLADLALAHLCTGADLLGSAAEFVHLEQIDVTVQRDRHSERFRDSVAGGTLFMPRGVYDAVGGFRPIPRGVDVELCRAVRTAGGRVYQIHGLGYILRRRAAQGHTWHQPIGYFLSARNRAQWRGWYANPLMELP